MRILLNGVFYQGIALPYPLRESRMIMVHGIPRMLSVPEPSACETQKQKNDTPLCHTPNIQNHGRGNNRGRLPGTRSNRRNPAATHEKTATQFERGNTGSSCVCWVFMKNTGISGFHCWQPLRKGGVLTKKSPEKSFPGIGGW